MTTVLNPILRRVEDQEAQHHTHAEFMLFAPEEHKAELIEGEIIVMPPPTYEHERLQMFLTTILSVFISRFNLGEVLGSRTAVYLSESNTYEPDLLFVSQARRHIITRYKLMEVPDLVIEILSASTAKYDRGRKYELYDQAGVQELWLLDPYGPAGTQFFQRRDQTLVEVAPVEGVIHSSTLTNFHLQTHWLWPNEQNQLINPVEVLKALGVM